MNKKWILVHVISGIAEKVELFDSLEEAKFALENSSRQTNMDNDDFSIFSIDSSYGNYTIEKSN